LLEEKDRRPARALAASSLLRRRDPGAGFSGRRSLGQFRFPRPPRSAPEIISNQLKPGVLFVSQAPQTNGLELSRPPTPRRAVMPGFAIAKPGTGQNAPSNYRAGGALPTSLPSR